MRELAERGEREMVIVRWPADIAPNRSHELRRCEIIEFHKQGVGVRCSWAPLSRMGALG